MQSQVWNSCFHEMAAGYVSEWKNFTERCIVLPKNSYIFFIQTTSLWRTPVFKHIWMLRGILISETFRFGRGPL